jgi:biotin transport system substrate-specific component
MNKSRLTVKHMVQCGISAALLAISAWLSIPMPQVSFTMQSFAVFFTLGLLGGRRGCISIVIYLLMGAVGLPVFSGFRGGLGILMGVTGGYIWGFLVAGLLYWAVTAVFGQKTRIRLAAMILGMAACYVCGTVWYQYIYGGNFWAVMTVCVLPYLLPDGIKILLAISLAGRLKKIIK